MGTYQSTPPEEVQSNAVSQSIGTYKCAIEMAKQEKNSTNILELINRNTIPTNSTQKEYNEVIDLLNDLMFTLASNEDNNAAEILKLDLIIGSVIYDRDHPPPGQLEADDDQTSEGDA